ncbi:anti-sigma factor family protein [Paraburkholderia flava]|uniref:anti-sigma factor family protein n=1 Tax=Paraburkholderia flava TaxID=2547393 RepID=UPI00105CC32B|nr:anti-sigma factor [Paraburkholderia flava]
MSMDEARLMAYVDGTLSMDERDDVEREIAGSSDAAECVAQLEASRLPYRGVRDAFAHQNLPPVPPALAARIDELARQHAPRSDARADHGQHGQQGQHYAESGNDAVGPDTSSQPQTPIRSRLRIAPAWLAVAFVAGAFCIGAVLRFAPDGAGMPTPWVQAATGYLQLYSRATVADARPDPDAVSHTIDAVRRDDRLALRVPDLRDAGMKFSEIQRLTFNGRPLVQLVYLPARGEPVALCVMKQPGPDQPIARQTANGMHVVTWRQGELVYALISASTDVDLAMLGQRIADRSFDQISGGGATPSNRRGESDDQGKWG